MSIVNDLIDKYYQIFFISLAEFEDFSTQATI